MERLMGYVDFDGVILDTETGLFDKYHEMKEKGVIITKERYLAEMDWRSWIEKASIIDDSIGFLKSISPNSVSILTKVHSFEEGKAKMDYLRRHGVKHDVIIVPYICKKHEIVNPKGKFLIDDYGGNLIGWQENGGIPIRFSVNPQKEYTDFVVVSSLEEVFEKFKY